MTNNKQRLALEDIINKYGLNYMWGANMAVYKVLDVREKESTYSYCIGSTDTHTVFTVIAEDKNGKRERFQMYDGYRSLVLDEWVYYGYEGDFSLLIEGDWFEIEETSTWPVVKILGVSDGT